MESGNKNHNKTGERGNPAETGAELSGIRLQKFLSMNGIASRRTCEEIIREGRVKINGQVEISPGRRVNPESETVTLDGRTIHHDHGIRPVYLVLNKPRGYIVTASDPQGRKTIFDLLEGLPKRVVTVGRLDRDSDGLLLLTDDGELVYRLTHPRFEVEKEYHVRVEGRPSAAAIASLKEGIVLDGKKTSPCLVDILPGSEENALLSMVIREGRKRQVRRMCESVGHPVMRLTRVREGSITLKRLGPGKYRELTQDEIRRLKKEVGLD